jgi:hypothetical protein
LGGNAPFFHKLLYILGPIENLPAFLGIGNFLFRSEIVLFAVGTARQFLELGCCEIFLAVGPPDYFGDVSFKERFYSFR